MIKTDTFTLDNGLRVVHHLDESTPMVAVNLLYNVGSKDENPDCTGIAHLLEHLMFGGSANVPDFERAIELAGGSNNAWTNSDFTNYFEVLPASNIETALWAESDRMNDLCLNDRTLEVQRQVVMEEFKQTVLNRPYGDAAHLLRSLLYKVHPYRWPTIGFAPEHIRDVDMATVSAFYRKHYAPNNAVLVISGNVTLDRTKELVKKWFGDIEPGEPATRLYAPEPPVTSPRRLEVTRPVPSASLTLAWPMCGRLHPQYEAADILTDVLGSGKSSRLVREFTSRGRLFSEITSCILGSPEPGYIMIEGRLSNPADTHAAEEALMEEIDKISTQGISEDELNRAVNRYESTLVCSNISYLNKAQTLAAYAMTGCEVNECLPRYSALTPDDIVRACRTFCKPESVCTLVYNPAEGSEGIEIED